MHAKWAPDKPEFRVLVLYFGPLRLAIFFQPLFLLQWLDYLKLGNNSWLTLSVFVFFISINYGC